MKPRIPNIYLASASPRRRELLSAMGVPFQVEVSTVDESKIPADHPRTFALRAAYLKATDVASRMEEESIIVAADTVVTHRSILYGKPVDAEDARRMLRALSNQTHEVITGVAVARAGSKEVVLESETTHVTFRAISDHEIDEYIATGCVFDKAGSYGIQSGGGEFVSSIRGDYFNVVGFPCKLVARLLGDSIGPLKITLPETPNRWRSA